MNGIVFFIRGLEDVRGFHRKLSDVGALCVCFRPILFRFIFSFPLLSLKLLFSYHVISLGGNRVTGLLKPTYVVL